LIHALFDEELDRLLRETANGGNEQAGAMLREARRISEDMIRNSDSILHKGQVFLYFLAN